MTESSREAATVNVFLLKYWSSSSTPEPQVQSALPSFRFFPISSLDFSTQLKFLFPCLCLVNHAEWGL